MKPGSLHYFVHTMDLNSAKGLLERNPTLVREVMAQTGMNSLHLAAQNKDLRMCELLVTHKANVKEKDATGKTPLHILCYSFAMHHEVSEKLLEKSKRIVKLFVDAGADINAQDRKNNAPIHYSCVSHNVELLRYLLQLGAKTNLQGENEATPLFKAWFMGKEEGLKVLLQAGSKEKYLTAANKEMLEDFLAGSAEELLKEEDLEQAKGILDRGLALAPNSPVFRALKERYDIAKRELDIMARKGGNQNQVFALLSSARHYIKQGNFIDACSSLRKALHLSPDNLNVKCDLALCCEKQHERARAEALHREVLAVAPHFNGSLTNLASMKISQAVWESDPALAEEGLALLRRCKIDGNDPDSSLQSQIMLHMMSFTRVRDRLVEEANEAKAAVAALEDESWMEDNTEPTTAGGQSKKARQKARKKAAAAAAAEGGATSSPTPLSVSGGSGSAAESKSAASAPLPPTPPPTPPPPPLSSSLSFISLVNPPLPSYSLQKMDVINEIAIPFQGQNKKINKKKGGK